MRPDPSISSSGPERLPIMSLFWGMVIRPRQTLSHLRDHGDRTWLWPALLSIAFLIGSFIVLAPIARAEAQEEVRAFQEQFAQQLPPSEQAQMEQAAELVGNPMFTVVIPAATGSLGLAIGWLARGAVLYFASLLFGGQARFPAMFRMGVWTTLPDIARRVVTTLGTLAAGRTLTPGLAFLVPEPPQNMVPSPATAVLRTFLGGLDLYLLWGLALLVLGVAVTARLSWHKSVLIVLIYWTLTTIARILPAWFGAVAAAGFVGP